MLLAIAKSLWGPTRSAQPEVGLQNDELGESVTKIGQAVVRKKSTDVLFDRFGEFKSVGMKIELLDDSGVRLTIPRGRNLIFCFAMLIMQAIVFGLLIIVAFVFWKAYWKYVELLLVFWMLLSTANQLLI